MEVFSREGVDFVILMVNFVHLVEDWEGVEESVCPVEEEVLYEIDK